MSRPLDPVTLRLFVAACEEGSLARAAAREAIVPSALSKRIGALERELGTPLLARTRRGLEPTAAGQALLRQSRELLATMERMRAELADFAGTALRGSVRVVASASALSEALPEDLAAFLDAHPSVRLSLDERNGRDVVREVRDGGADLGVVWDAVDTAGLATRPYRVDHMAVLLPPGHPLAARPRLRFAETLEHPWVNLVPGGLADTLLRRQAALLGRPFAPRTTVSSLEAGVRIVAAGFGLTVAPAEAVAARVATLPLVLRPLDEPWAERRFAIVTRPQEAAPGSAAAAMAEHLRACAAPQSPGIA